MAVIAFAIGSLVLRGVAPADAPAVRAGLEAELVRLVGREGRRLASARAPVRLEATACANPRETGAAIARALIEGVLP